MRTVWPTGSASGRKGGQKLFGEPVPKPTTTRARPTTSIAAKSTSCTWAPSCTPRRFSAKTANVSSTPSPSTGRVTGASAIVHIGAAVMPGTTSVSNVPRAVT